MYARHATLKLCLFLEIKVHEKVTFKFSKFKIVNNTENFLDLFRSFKIIGVHQEMVNLTFGPIYQNDAFSDQTWI